MKRRVRKSIVLLIGCVLLALLVGGLWLARGRTSKISVGYIQTIDGHGHWRLRFGVTNVGNCTVWTSGIGEIEVLNHTNVMRVGATSPLSKLAPGEGQLVDAVVSPTQMDSIDNRWRFTCLYAQDSLRSRIYGWQWGSGGPGARVNWLIPRGVKGRPLTVKGTSDWVERGK